MLGGETFRITENSRRMLEMQLLCAAGTLVVKARMPQLVKAQWKWPQNFAPKGICQKLLGSYGSGPYVSLIFFKVQSNRTIAQSDRRMI